jgi:hypothetical protein
MPATPSRNVRIPDEEWYGAMRRAESDGLSLTDAIRAFCRAYMSGAIDVTAATGATVSKGR